MGDLEKEIKLILSLSSLYAFHNFAWNKTAYRFLEGLKTQVFIFTVVVYNKQIKFYCSLKINLQVT